MKTIKSFIGDSIELKNNITVGGDSGCYETEYKSTYGAPSDSWGYDDTVVHYDDNMNEVGWEFDRY